MWRNVSWNSTDSSLPDGMHRHEPGPYFKTPSIQSTNSAGSGAGTASDLAPPAAAGDIARQRLHGLESLAPAQGTEDLEQSSEASETTRVLVPPLSCGSGGANQEGVQKSATSGKTAGQQPPAQRRTRFKDGGQQPSSSSTRLSHSGATQKTSQGQQQPHAHPQGFRSRLSSISGALQHPKLARRLFSSSSSGANEHHEQQPSAIVQITTTSIDSPQHSAAGGSASEPGAGNKHEPSDDFQQQPFAPTHSRPSSSGRRLSQLFVPQQLMLGQHPMLLSQLQDPNELIPPHLLGLYGQPPLVGGAAGCAQAGGLAMMGQPNCSPGGHRASWADISLFGRLTNVRPSIDSTFAGQLTRHSFDARK